MLERIRTLAIPPAWSDVWICPWPNGHIQAVGTDAAGRRQYRYHDAWRRRRDAEKFDRMLELAATLPALRTAVSEALAGSGLERQRVLALGVRLLDIGMFRIGGEEYAEAHETYGLATLERRHVVVRKGVAVFDYAAKGGKQRLLAVTDPLVVDLVGQLKRRRGGGDELLAWRDGRRWVDVRSEDLNDYIKDVTGGPFSAKDFRTWSASLLAAVRCAEFAVSAGTGRRPVAAIVRDVADALGNTPAVCRKSYIDPRVLDRFEHGETIEKAVAAMQPIDLSDDLVRAHLERAVVTLLAEHGESVTLASVA